jgi:hypothetical protein
VMDGHAQGADSTLQLLGLQWAVVTRTQFPGPVFLPRFSATWESCSYDVRGLRS